MPNAKIWIVPQTEEYIKGKDEILMADIYGHLFTTNVVNFGPSSSRGEVSPTVSKRKCVVSVLESNHFAPILAQWSKMDKRQVWKRAKSDEQLSVLRQVIDSAKAVRFLQDKEKFEIQDFIDATIGATSCQIQRVAGNYLRGLGYSPKQRRHGDRRVSLWSKNWED